MAYISLAELKTYMGIPTSDTTADTKLQTFIDAAQKFIENYTGKVFEASATSTRYFHAIEDVDGFVLFLDRDLANITSLVVVNGDGETIPGSAFVTEPRNTFPARRIRLKQTQGYVWDFDDDPENAISVTGYFATSASADANIKQATRRLASYLYHQKDNAGDLDRPMQMMDGVVYFPATLPKDIVLLLEHYVWNLPV
jgi:hypothetical protein